MRLGCRMSSPETLLCTAEQRGPAEELCELYARRRESGFNFDWEEPGHIKSMLTERFRLACEQDRTRDMYHDHLRNFGQAIMQAGVQLIPSEHLSDGQVVVSRAVFDAVKGVM